MAVNFDKFTYKSQEALQKAIEIAMQMGHQQIETEHLAYSLLNIEGGLVVSFLERLGVSAGNILEILKSELNKNEQVIHRSRYWWHFHRGRPVFGE